MPGHALKRRADVFNDGTSRPSDLDLIGVAVFHAAFSLENPEICFSSNVFSGKRRNGEKKVKQSRNMNELDL